MIKGSNTKPEIVVRRIAHRMGFRFRLHVKELPGRPDIVFKKLKKVVFVNGCFWHRHQNCKYSTEPKTNKSFWQKKFADNVLRDKKNQEKIINIGWDFLILWECETKDTNFIEERLRDFLK